MRKIIILFLLMAFVVIAVAHNNRHIDQTTTPVQTYTYTYQTPIPTATPPISGPIYTSRVVPTTTPTPTPTPTPIQLDNYDNIVVHHTITLCNPVSDAEYAITGLSTKNCGNPDLDINHYPLDDLPSGGDSGKVSAGEMLEVKVRTDGHISLIPWESQTVWFYWYDGSNNKLLAHLSSEATSFNNEVICIIGHFSWELSKPGMYYVIIDEGDLGSARVVFNVT